MKAVLPSLKSCFSRLVIKIRQALADMSIQRQATCLIMFFNHRVEREYPTLGSLSTSCTLNGLKRVQLNPTFSDPRVTMWWNLRAAAGWIEQKESESDCKPSSPTYIVTCMHNFCMHQCITTEKLAKHSPRATSVNNVFLFNLLG